jgi:hypothetical protein
VTASALRLIAPNLIPVGRLCAVPITIYLIIADQPAAAKARK